MASFLTFWQAFHGHIRWLIVVIIVIALLKFLAGWLGKMEYKKIDRTLMVITAGVFGIQFLVGIVLLLGNSASLYFALDDLNLFWRAVGHGFTMIIAVMVVSMGSVRAKRTNGSNDKFRIQSISLLVGLILVYFGVTMVPAGWALAF